MEMKTNLFKGQNSRSFGFFSHEDEIFHADTKIELNVFGSSLGTVQL